MDRGRPSPRSASDEMIVLKRFSDTIDHNNWTTARFGQNDEPSEKVPAGTPFSGSALRAAMVAFAGSGTFALTDPAVIQDPSSSPTPGPVYHNKSFASLRMKEQPSALSIRYRQRENMSALLSISP